MNIPFFNYQSLFKQHEKNLLNIAGVKKVKTLLETKQVYVRYPIWVADKKKVVNLAKANRVEIASWYESPVHPYVEDDLSNLGYQIGSCPNAENSSNHIISLVIPKKMNTWNWF